MSAQHEEEHELFSSLERACPWFPWRGFLYSFFVHELLFVVAVFGPWNYWLPGEATVSPLEFSAKEPHEIVWLPPLDPAGAGERRAARPDKWAPPSREAALLPSRFVA